MMRITYSPEVDALAIRLGSSGGKVGTKEIGPGVFADFDEENGRFLAIEVLDASTHYDRAELEKLASPVEYLTLAEAAKVGKLSPTTLRNQINAGRIPALKRGRDWLVARHELLTYIANRAPQGRRSAARSKFIEKRKRRAAGADRLGGPRPVGSKR
jgi:excisionase family DNA binding protein